MRILLPWLCLLAVAMAVAYEAGWGDPLDVDARETSHWIVPETLFSSPTTGSVSGAASPADMLNEEQRR